MKRPKRLDFTPEEVEALIERIENQSPQPEDFPLIADLLRAMIWLEHSLKEKTLSIVRLRSIFGIKTESAKKLAKFLENQSSENSSSSSDQDPSLLSREEDGAESTEEGSKERGNHSKSPGHGHRPSSDYTEARIIPIAHEALKRGMLCPECRKGKLFNLSPGTVLRITGQPWLNVDIYKPERLRCSVCQKIFTANLPKELYTESRCDKTAKAIVSIMKYRGGVPFYRQEQIQGLLGNPISATEIWEMTKDVANQLEPIFNELCQLAANCECIHNDDTSARVLNLMKENKEETPERTGIFTTALLAKYEKREIALFFTGREHAGENLGRILDNREEGLPSPIQSCDALSRNLPKNHQTQVAYCNAHLRRKFYEIASMWPKECLNIICGLNIVFLNDKKAAMENLNPKERLKWHQEKSALVMEKTRAYCKTLIDDKQVEPNSSLGKAINYLENYWEGFTLFLRIPNVPISNNADERLMKRAVLNRKNSYFFKTEAGARMADILMSVIETCVLNQVNPYQYLIAIQQYPLQVLNHPEVWLPWNYEASLKPP
jgi:arsenate reductase-like glutaredoxin family protein